MKNIKLSVKEPTEVMAYQTSDDKAFGDMEKAREHERMIAIERIKSGLCDLFLEMFPEFVVEQKDGHKYLDDPVQIAGELYEDTDEIVDLAIEINTELSGRFKKFVDKVGQAIK